MEVNRRVFIFLFGLCFFILLAKHVPSEGNVEQVANLPVVNVEQVANLPVVNVEQVANLPVVNVEQVANLLEVAELRVERRLAVQSLSSESYNWRSFTKLDGLLSNNVNAIAQDLQGNLWFATSVGVSRYNGLWQNFTVDDGLCDNDVIGVVVDDSGIVWFGTAIGVCYFDGSTWRTFDFSDRVLCITQSPRNEIWIGTAQGVFLFDDGKMTDWTQNGGDELELGVSAIFRDSDEKIWFGINSYPAQLSCFDGSTDWTIFSVKDGLPAGQIRSICEDWDGNIWIGTSDGVAKFDGSSWRTYTVADGLAGNDVRSVMLKKNGDLWFATSNGVSVFDNSVAEFARIRIVDGIASNDVQAILEDRDGGMWLGTADRGISYTDRKWQSITAQSVLPDDTINAIFEDSRGNMWFGTPKGLVKFDGDNWSTITTTDGLPGNEIRAITEISKSSVSLDLWVGTDKGLGVYDGTNWTALTQAEGLGYDNVHTIAADTANNVWVGAGLYVPGQIDLFGGVSKFDGIGWESMTMDSTVSCILEDSRGTLWICTYTDGVIRINRTSIDKVGTEDGLASNSIFAVAEHPNGTIWFGTDRGISIFDEGNWSTLTTDDGLADNRVRTIFISVTGETPALPQIWVGTADGVSLFRDDMWIQRTVDDGLNSNAVRSIFVSNNGDVWLGTDESGLTRYIREENPPKTSIVSGPKGVIGDRTVTFEFIGGDASTPTDQLLYSYRLNDLSWSSFTPKIFVTFTNLEDKKDHVFFVRSKDKDGNIDAIGAWTEFTIDATPPSVEIDDPLENQIISANYEIWGSAMDESDFREYKVEVADFSTDWLPVEVENNVLAEWDTSSVADGIYTIELSARDKIEGPSDIQHTNQTSVKVEVDNTPPDVKIISPENVEQVANLPSGFEGSGVIMIEAQIEDKNLTNYRLTYMQELSTEKQIYFAEATEKIEFPLWDSSNVYGETILKVSAEDAAGNIGSDQVMIDLKNDSANPIVSIDSPSENDVIAGDFSIVGTAEDSTLKEFLLEYNDELEWQEIKRGDYSIKNDVIAIWDTKPLSDGTYLIRLSAIDDNGYPSSIKRTIKIDNTNPIASIDLPSIIQGSVDTKIIGTAYDKNFQTARLEYASLDVPDQWNLIDEPILVSKQNEVLGTWNSSGYEGKFRIRLTVTDLAGNSMADTQVLTVDSVGVQLEIVEPITSQVVSGKLSIIGTARDANFGYCSLFFRKDTTDNWQEIALQITEQKENEQIAVWDTTGLDGLFSIKLFAVDQSGNSNEIEQSGIRVDNSPPVVSIDYPKNGQQIGRSIDLIGAVADENLAEYTIEYCWNVEQVANLPKDASQIVWHSISPVSFTKSVENGYLGTWNLPGQSGKYALRLKAVDLVGHESDTKISVSLPEMLDAKNGGIAVDEKKSAWIVFPPNSLPSSTVITVNEVVSASRSERTGDRLVLNRQIQNIYDFEPEVVFNSLKPATISIAYSTEEQSQNIGKVAAIFFYEPVTEKWKELGGTIDRDDQTVTAATYQTGRYALRWVESEENEDRCRISNLTCQPRVFRPNINPSIAISFELSLPTEVTVKIYNMAGRLKRVVEKKASLRKGSNVLHWDAKDRDFRQVPSGAYIVTVQTEDQVVKKSVVVWND